MDSFVFNVQPGATLMKETTHVDSLVALLRTRGSIVFKTNDRATSGIPDVIRVGDGSTSWIEVKYLRPGEKLVDIVEMVQVTTGLDLWSKNSERACFAVYSAHKVSNPGLTLWAPWLMLRQFRSTEPMGFESCEDTIINVAEQLRTRGAARVSKFDHRFVLRWLSDLDTQRRSKV